MEHAEYNVYLVALSFIVAWYGSYAALNTAIRIPTAETGGDLFAWLSKSAIAVGGGIWSMHFIGMLAYEMNMPVRYEPIMTIASLVLAIVVCGIGLFIVGRGTSNILRLLAGGTVTGLGVASMHYIGMDAMEMPAKMTYDMPLFIASLVIAVVAATAALWLAFNMRGLVQQFLSAVVMAVAVCGMHYTGMLAIKYEMTEHVHHATGSSSSPVLALIIFVIASAVFTALVFIASSKTSNQTLTFDD